MQAEYFRVVGFRVCVGTVTCGRAARPLAPAAAQGATAKPPRSDPKFRSAGLPAHAHDKNLDPAACGAHAVGMRSSGFMLSVCLLRTLLPRDDSQ